MFRLALFRAHIYFFCFLRHQSWHFAPRNMCCGKSRASRSNWVQSADLDIVNRSLCSLCVLALVIGLALHILTTQWWWVPRRTKQLSTVAILHYCHGSCHVWCLKTTLKYQPCSLFFAFTFLFFGWLDLLLAAFIVCGPLQFLVSNLDTFSIGIYTCTKEPASPNLNE